jgi:hypothetical protein
MPCSRAWENARQDGLALYKHSLVLPDEEKSYSKT